MKLLLMIIHKMPMKPTTLLELVGMLTERDKFFKRGSDLGYQMNMIVYGIVKINVLMQIYKKKKTSSIEQLHHNWDLFLGIWKLIQDIL